MPIQGIWDDNSFRYRGPTVFPLPDSHRVPVTGPANHVSDPMP